MISLSHPVSIETDFTEGFESRSGKTRTEYLHWRLSGGILRKERVCYFGFGLEKSTCWDVRLRTHGIELVLFDDCIYSTPKEGQKART